MEGKVFGSRVRLMLYATAGVLLCACLTAIVAPEAFTREYLPLWVITLMRVLGLLLCISATALLWENLRQYVTEERYFISADLDGSSRKDFAKDRRILHGVRDMIGVRDRESIVPELRKWKADRGRYERQLAKEREEAERKFGEELQESRRLAESRRVRVQALESEVRQARNDLSAARMRLEKLESELEQRCSEALKRAEEVARLQEDVEVNAIERDDLSASLTAARSDLSRLNGRVSKLESKLRTARADAKRLEMEVVQPLRRELSSANAEIGRLADAKRDAEETLRTLQQEHGLRVTELTSVTRERDRLRVSLLETEAQRKSAVTALEPIRQELSRSRTTASQLQADLSKAHAALENEKEARETIAREQSLNWRVIDILTEAVPDQAVAAIQQAEQEVGASN